MTLKKGRKQSEATKEKLRNVIYWRHSQKLTEDDVREVRKLISEGRATMKAIADRFGVTPTVIYRIRDGDTFRWVT